MKKSERAIVVILRIIGIGGLFAIPAILLPFSWMNRIHEFLGLGELPDAPIVRYLARSLSAFYAIVSAMTLFISLDIRRNRSLVKVLAIMFAVAGVVLLGIDIESALPMSWTLCEGPPVIAVGVIILVLHRHIVEPTDTT